MYINKAISFFTGWETLTNNPTALSEIKQIISKVEYSVALKSESATLHVDTGMVRPVTLNREVKTFVRKMGWYQPNKFRKLANIPDINYLKHSVSLDFSLNSGTGLERHIDKWILVDSNRDQAYQECNLSVLIVLDTNPAWLHFPTTYQPSIPTDNFYRIVNHIESRVLPIYHRCPMVILTISEEPSAIEIVELANSGSRHNFERVLEFTHENYQAGVAILSYFGEILKQKYPDIEAKVTIEQDDYKVRMTIVTPDGNQEIIEEALNTYTQVVIKEKEPEELLDNRIQISELKMQLSMIETQLEHKKELLMLSDERYKNDVVATRNEVEFLRLCLSKQMQMTQDSHVLIGKQIDKDEKVTLAQLSYFDNTIQALVEQSYGNQALIDALNQLQNLLDRGVSAKDEQESKEILEIIKHESPSTYGQLSELLKNSMYGVSGNMIFTWMTEIAKQLC